MVVLAGSVGVSIDTGAIAARSSEGSSSTGTAPEAGRAAAAGDAPSVGPTTAAGSATFRRFGAGARGFLARAALRFCEYQ